MGRHRPEPRAFDFAAIGDQQYGAPGEQKWPALQASINRAGVAFVIHIGDIKSGDTVCSNEMFQDRLSAFNNFDMPMIITPGDNEWTDCHRENNGSYDPLERLDYERRIFYPDNQSLGRRKMTLSQQSEDPRYFKYVENAMWSMGNVLFGTLHMVGSNNNLGRNAENDREWAERTAANFNWLKTIFSVARDNGFAGVVIGTQTNPGWSGTPVRNTALRTGMKDTFFVLEDDAIVFGRPVLVVMGDSHIFRIDKPVLAARSGRVLENLLRVEVPGSEYVHWVRVRVDPAKRGLFSFEHEDIVDNLFPQQRP
ncbi:MAG: metallophosphoesterase family protein [Bryobacteraceae bacterium]